MEWSGEVICVSGWSWGGGSGGRVEVLELTRVGGEVVEFVLVGAPDGVEDVVGGADDAKGFIGVV